MANPPPKFVKVLNEAEGETIKLAGSMTWGEFL
jgi:hypothetical protein